MSLWIILISAICAMIDANFAVDGMLKLIVNENEFTDDAIEAVFNHTESLRGRLLARSGFLDCSDRLDSRSCNYLTHLGACNTKMRSMQQYCQKSCGFCVDPPCHLSKHGCCLDGKTTSTGPHMRGCKDDCRDTISTAVCKSLKANNKCFKTGDLMRTSCAVTCGYCRPCIDEEPYLCQYTAKYDACSSGKALDGCRKSCNQCGKNDPCYNHVCPKNSVCRISKTGTSFCECDGKCKKGDYFTGEVCGRDGVKYKNLCSLKKRNCGTSSVTSITVKEYGPCNTVTFSDRRRKICKKKHRKTSRLCKEWEAAGFCKQRRTAMAQICPGSCNLCSPQFPKPSCAYRKHGCCLDGNTLCLDTNYKGCPKSPACKDFSKVFCTRFVALCGASKHKETMKKYCPQSCHLCGKM